MAVMKQVVLSLSQKESSSQHSTQSPIKVEKLTHPLRQPVTKHGNNRDERITDPTPTVFVSFQEASVT